MSERMEGGAADGAPEAESGAFHGEPQAAVDRCHRALAIFDDVGVGPLAGVAQDDAELLADRHYVWASQGLAGLVLTDRDEAELGIEVLLPRQRQ